MTILLRLQRESSKGQCLSEGTETRIGQPEFPKPEACPRPCPLPPAPWPLGRLRCNSGGARESYLD